ncbi:hypothetical protein KI688_011361 [Linnemannia hyalina]|uniref:Rab-GAP TBC domain-containing protein n=1 Tax=Linnemannia hyalina TaxID=64524 RepID=A0A9P7XUR6_9FUNG|nr:hypothetical protein KI688_011361 [Linnemannia hyalina]
MESYIARISRFERYLDPDDGQTISLKEFKELCFGGKFYFATYPWTRHDGTSFVKDLIVEPELGEADFIKDEREDSDWSLFLQDNKTLEQIDKDVRRTLPDFAFFQLPIPYSPLCPLSIEPRTRKPKQQPKQQQPMTSTKADEDNTATAPIATTTATHNNTSSNMINTLLSGSSKSAPILETGTSQIIIPNHYTHDSTSMLSRSLPKSPLTPRISIASGGLPFHLDLGTKGSPIARSMTPTLKRRQTVTLRSPRAEKKPEFPKTANEPDSWPIPGQDTENGTETPPLANGFRTPVDDTTTAGINGIGSSYSSPVPSRLRGMASNLVDSEEEDEKPTLPDYLFSPIPTRRSLFKRVAHLNQDFGSREHQPHTLQASRSQENWIKKRKDLLSNGRKTAEAAAAAMGTAASPIDVPLSSSPEPTMEDPQTSRRAALKNRWDDDYSFQSNGSKSESQDKGDDEDDEEEDDELPQDLHWEAIERILFIYAKLNPGVGYVQGMNEILGPLYYLLANDPDETSRAHAEAESFWLFHLLMAHFRDHFVRSLDRDRVSGIGSTIARMNLRLRHFDEDLWQNLEDKGIAPEYYSFRWLTVLCTQEFEVPDVWRIWDSVLADTGGVEKDYDFLLDFGCAMVCHLRSDLLDGDFADNVKLLQNYPPVDIQPILQLATVIRDQRVNESFHYVVSAPDPKESANNGHHQHQHHQHQQHQQHSSRRSIDFRTWTSSNNNSNTSSGANMNDAASDYGNGNGGEGGGGGGDGGYMDNRIDGVQNSDRLDHNLEGTDHRSPMYIPRSATFKKDKPPSISGLSLDGLWTSRSYSTTNNNGPMSGTMTGDRGRGGWSPSGLSVDNYVMNGSSDSSRPQTGTWAETFSLFKAKFVGTSSVSGVRSPISPCAGNEGGELRRESHGSIGPLIPSAEI